MRTSNSHLFSLSDQLYCHTGLPCSIQLILLSHFEFQWLYSSTVLVELNDPLPEAEELVISLEASALREG